MILGLKPAAKALGISHVALWKAEKSGRVKKTETGQYDVEACRTALELNSHPIKSKAGRTQQVKTVKPEAEEPDVPVTESIAEAVRQLEWEKLRSLKQKTDREEGKLADVVMVNAFVAGMIIKTREELVRIGAELADTLAQEADPVKCRAHVDDRIFQSLENLKQYQA